jgi:hypothetical protein
MNSDWEYWADSANPPERATAECRMADFDMLIELIDSSLLTRRQAFLRTGLL